MPGLALVEFVASDDGTEALDDVIEDRSTLWAIDVQLVEDLLRGDGSVNEVSHIDALRKVNTGHLLLELFANQELSACGTLAIVALSSSVSRGLSFSLLLILFNLVVDHLVSHHAISIHF